MNTIDINKTGLLFHGTYLEEFDSILKWGLVSKQHFTEERTFDSKYYKKQEPCPCNQQIPISERDKINFPNHICFSVIGSTPEYQRSFSDLEKRPFGFPSPYGFHFGFLINPENYVKEIPTKKELIQRIYLNKDKEAERQLRIKEYYQELFVDIYDVLNQLENKKEVKLWSCTPWKNLDAIIISDYPATNYYSFPLKKEVTYQKINPTFIAEEIIRKMEKEKKPEERIPILNTKGEVIYSCEDIKFNLYNKKEIRLYTD